MKSLDATPGCPHTPSVAEPPVSPELFAPIGAPASAPDPPAPRHPGAPRLSAPEKRLRAMRANANQQPQNPHAMIHAKARTLTSTGQYRAPLTRAEQVGMASTLAAEFFEEAMLSRCGCGHLATEHGKTGCRVCTCVAWRGQDRRLSDAKHAAVAWAVAQDKLSLLEATSGKAIEPLDLGPGELARRALIRRLLALEPGETGTATTNAEQP